MENGGSRLKYSFMQDINPVIRFLIISDTVIYGAAGMMGPIFALFIADFIQGGNEAVAGMAVGIYLLTKSIFQIPVAHLVDRIRGERDDFWFMFIFSIGISLTPLLYLFIDKPIELYGVQFMLGIFAAFTFPTYMAIFTRHIDKKKEGTEWGLYFTLVDLMSAALAALGGYIATTNGFHVLIIAVAILSLLGSLMLLSVKPYLKI